MHPLLGACGGGDGAAGSWGAYFPCPPAYGRGFLPLPLVSHGSCHWVRRGWLLTQWCNGAENGGDGENFFYLT